MQKNVDHEIYSLDEKVLSLNYAEKTIKVRETSTDSGQGIRVLKDGRLGFSYCQQENEIKDAIHRAAAVSDFSPKTNFSFQKKSKYKKLNLKNKKVSSLNIKELGEILHQVRDGAEHEVDRCKILLNQSETEIKIENTKGLHSGYSKAEIDMYVESVVGDGYGFSFYSSHKLLKDPHSFGLKAAKMAKEMHKPKKISPGNYTIVLTPESLPSILSIFIPSFSGEWKRKGITKLGNKLGKLIFSEKFSMYEDGTDIRSSSAVPFDDEGTPSKKRSLVTRGIPKQFLYDMETAALAKVKADGFCARSDYSSMPSIGNSTLIINSGKHTNFEEELKECIVVHSMHGSHTSNPTTGDFGLEVNSAFHIKNGKKIPVRGFILSGNVFKLFKEILGMEKKQEVFDDIIAPRMAFRGVQVIA